MNFWKYLIIAVIIINIFGYSLFYLFFSNRLTKEEQRRINLNTELITKTLSNDHTKLLNILNKLTSNYVSYEEILKNYRKFLYLLDIDYIFIIKDNKITSNNEHNSFIKKVLQEYPSILSKNIVKNYGYIKIDSNIYSIVFQKTGADLIGIINKLNEQHIKDITQLDFHITSNKLIFKPIKLYIEDLQNKKIILYYGHNNIIYIEWRTILSYTMIVLAIFTILILSIGIYYFGKRIELENNLISTKQERLEEQQQCRVVLDRTPDAIVIIQDKKICYANPAAKIQYSPQQTSDIIGVSLQDLIHKDDRQQFKERFKEILSVGVNTPMTYRFVKSDGSIMFGESIGTKIQHNGRTAILSVIRDVSTRKYQETILEAKNDLIVRKHRILRAIIDNSEDFIYAKDSHNRFIEANLAVSSWMGVDSPKKLIGKTDHDFYDHDEAQIYNDIENTIMDTGKAAVNIVDQITNLGTGEKRWYLTNKYPMFNNKGVCIGTVGTGRDITEFREQHQSLYNLDKSIQVLPLGVTIVNLDGEIIYTNSIEAEMHGYNSPNELLGKNSRIFSPEDKWHHFNSDHVSSWNGYTRHSTNIRKDGSTFPVELTSEIIYDDDNNPIFIITISKDITQQRKIEHELDRLKIAIETSDVGVTITDNQGCIVYINDADVKMHGYDSELDLIGKRSHVLAPMEIRHKDFRSNGVHDEYPNWRRETTNIKQNGTEFPVEIISNPIYDRNGDFQGRVSICSDITLRKEQEETMSILLEKVPFGIAVINKQLNIVHVNQVAADLIGKPVSDILNTRCHDTICSSNTNNTCPFFDSEENIYKQECILCTASGENVPILKSILHIKLKGEPMILETFIDIRERVEAENALKYNQQLLQTILDTIPDFVYVKNTLHEFILTNKTVLNTYNCRMLSEILGKTDYDLHPQQQADKYYKEDEIVLLSGEKIIDSEELIQTPQSGDMWVLASKVPLLDQDNNIVGIVGINKDITKHKHHELKLQKQKEEYQKLYRMVRDMCDNVPDLIWAKDLDNKYIFANKAMCDKLLVATSTNEPLGKTDMFFAERQRHMYPNNPQWHTFGEICRDTDTLVLDSDTPQRFDECGNVQGIYLFLDVYKAPFKNQHDVTIGTVGSGRIVTKERAAKKALERAHTVFKSLYDIGKHIMLTNSTKDVMEIIANKIPDLLHSDTGAILLLDESKSFLYIEEASGLSKKTILNTHDKVGESIAGRVVLSGKPLIIHDIQNNPIYNNSNSDKDLLSCISVPIVGSNGIIGTLDSHSKIDKNAFSKEDISTLELLASYTALAIENTTLYEELEFSKEQYKRSAQQVSRFLKGMRS